METASTHLQQFRLMGRYNTWINGRLFDVAAKLTEEERKRDMGAFFHSVHGTLNHLLLTDRHWMHRFATCTPRRFNAFEGAKLITELGAHGRELFSGFGELRAERAETDRVIGSWLEELDPDMLSLTMRYATSQGVERVHPLWFAMAHLFNHQTHHRSQATTLIQQLGHDYGITDFLAMYHLAPDAF
jgi:uncharacterized damage-inducible protein DinB